MMLPIPCHSTTRIPSGLRRLQHSFRQSYAAKAHVAAPALEELYRAPEQGLLGEHVLAVVELAAGDGALAAAVQLPQRAVLRLDEAHVVQVHVVARVGRRRVALARRFLVRRRELGSRLEKGGALGRREGDGGSD